MVRTSLNTPLINKPKFKEGESSKTPITPPIPMDTSPIHSPIPLQIRRSPPQLTIESTKSTPPSSQLTSQLTNFPSSQTPTPKPSSLPKPPTEKRKLEGSSSTQGELTVKSRGMELKIKKLIDGFAVNTTWCKLCKFSELLEILEFQNWMNLFDEFARKPLYPDAMCEFKQNFAYIDGCYTSSVNGTQIVIDDNYLSVLFGVPNDGFASYEKNKKVVSINGVDKDAILEFIGGDAKSNSTHQSRFTPLLKLVFNLVWQMLVPRTQHRNSTNLLDACLMYFLVKRIRVNFPQLMLSHLRRQIENNNLVSYGNLLTNVFVDFKVDLTGYKCFELRSEDYIQESALSRLKLKVVNGITCDISGELGVDGGDEEDDVGIEELPEVIIEKKPRSQPREATKPRIVPKRRSIRVALGPRVVKPPAFVELSGDEEEVSSEEPLVIRRDEGGPSGVNLFQVPSSGTSFGTTSVPSFPTFATFGTSSLEKKTDTLISMVESAVSGQAQLQQQVKELQEQMRSMEQLLQTYPGHVKATEESILARINSLEFQEQEEVPSPDEPAP